MRSFIQTHSDHDQAINKIIDKDTFDKAYDRFQKEFGESAYFNGIKQILPYLDFGDSIQIILRNIKSFPSGFSDEFKAIHPALQRITQIRNRVMHGRPLEVDDLTRVLDLVSACLKCVNIKWAAISDFRDQMSKNGNFIYGINIPSVDESKTRHNLPIPDFDETGYIGRSEDERELRRHLEGPYPVISVIGEGGLGKTGLVLKVIYSLLDQKPDLFDAVIWSSARTKNVGIREITQIRDSIGTSLGIFQAIQSEFTGQVTSDPVAEILEYLKEFKVLLILDNLETIKDKSVESFLDQLPTGSKVVITSRVGLGQFEKRLNLKPLDTTDSVRLIRILSKARGIADILSPKEEELRTYAERLSNNPGFIKWFASGVQSGLRPCDMFSNMGIFLDFCMENIYKFLSAESRHVISCIQCAQIEMTQAEISYVSDLESITLQESINQLMTTNILRLEVANKSESNEVRYNLSEIAREYMTLRKRPDPKLYSHIRAKVKNLSEETASAKYNFPKFRYKYECIQTQTKSQVVLAKRLKQALEFSSVAQYSKAIDIIDKARMLEPNYCEIHRVAAQVYCASGQYSLADDSYAKAVELNPDSPTIRYWFGAFLARYALDYERALNQLQEALRLDQSEPIITIELARVQMFNGNLEEANSLITTLSCKAMHYQSKRKAADLLIQIQLKQSIQSSKGGTLESLQVRLVSMLESISNLNQNSIDEGVASSAIKALKFAEKCTREFFTSGQQQAILTKHLEAKSQLTALGYQLAVENPSTTLRGVVDRLINESFGYIAAEDGAEYYFNMKAVRGFFQSASMLSNQEVTFELGHNYEGVCATNVRVAMVPGESNSADYN